MLDINQHLVKHHLQQVAPDNFTTFQVLAEAKIVSKQLAQDVAPLAGLRNVLSHDYDALDYQILHQSAQKAIDLIPEYLHSLETALAE